MDTNDRVYTLNKKTNQFGQQKVICLLRYLLLLLHNKDIDKPEQLEKIIELNAR